MSEGESESFLGNSAAEYTWKERFAASELFFGCSESLTVDHVCLYNLDSSYKAEKEDYSDDTKTAEMWVVKDTVIGETKNSIIPVICIVIGLIIVLTVVVFIIIKNKRVRRK